ncbi:MAG: L,D-transpeptidase family protein [Francisellaceae bacterium]|jgi:L,D-transpeptidase ErfK/SrfK|nr:L,D-transpeptidase family protein [Francisellaceae bacterium]MBT6207896.1 L,D-transpeptidase family protein [Francisellaceae bacterium]MBT6538861.1 L,D-transpeptidase family protein [Francisellaceae bacterium]
MRPYLLYLLLLAFPCTTLGLTFLIPDRGNIIGGVQTVESQRGESLGDIGRRFDIGIYEMIEANPKVNPWSIGSGKKITIPTQFILPPGPKSGIVINLAEMRLYFYHPDQKLVTTHPIGIGRKGWRTPIGTAKIIQKKKDPAWYPPDSIRESYERKGKSLPNVVPPGPDNPLGQFAMRISIPGYLIHGTNKPGGIGVRSSSGCIRMYPEDIESLFYKTKLGTQVSIVHIPYKVGKKNGHYFIEAHEPLSEKYYQNVSQQEMFKKAFEDANASSLHVQDWDDAEDMIDQSNGLPMAISY